MADDGWRGLARQSVRRFAVPKLPGVDPLPSMAAALGLRPEDTIRIEGSITRVDEHGAAIPGKKAFMMRAWLSADARRIPLVMESDLWVGAIRLVISGYDPPTTEASREPDSRAASP